jgi:hypothetical protein
VLFFLNACGLNFFPRSVWLCFMRPYALSGVAARSLLCRVRARVCTAHVLCASVSMSARRCAPSPVSRAIIVRT